jgi:hypothetical protein
MKELIMNLSARKGLPSIKGASLIGWNLLIKKIN